MFILPHWREWFLLWNILQYTDDICFSKTTAIYEESYKNQTKLFENLTTFCDLKMWKFHQRSLQLWFFQNRFSDPSIMILENYELPVREEVIFSDFLYWKKLTSRSHKHTILRKSEKGLNLIRSINKNKWGFHPDVSLTLNRSLIRSIVNYGPLFYRKASKTYLIQL